MKDKQIIIDDYFRKIVDINGKIVDYEIKNSEVSKLVQKIEKYNSYIERKEKECEELKKWLPIVARLEERFKSHEKAKGIDYKNYAEQVFTELDQLKAENERLKRRGTPPLIDVVLIENKQLKETNESLLSVQYKLADSNKKLRQTLDEIKEIAKPYQRDIDKICGYCRKYDSCHACCIDDLKLYEYRTGTTKACERFVELERFNINIVANQILQKISEVENESYLNNHWLFTENKKGEN